MVDSKPRFTYFDGRGLGEATRLALAAAGFEYEDIYLRTRGEFLQLISDGKLPFKQVPLLEMDGLAMVGSEPTARYVCHKAKLEGKTDADQAKIEYLAMGARDLLKSGIMGNKFQKTPEAQEEMFKSSVKQASERYFPAFEKVLSESKSGFLVGDSMSIADIMFFDSVSYFKDIPEARPALAEFPRCAAFIEHFSAQPGIKEYLASPKRHPPADDEYVRGVRVVLNP